MNGSDLSSRNGTESAQTTTTTLSTRDQSGVSVADHSGTTTDHSRPSTTDRDCTITVVQSELCRADQSGGTTTDHSGSSLADQNSLSATDHNTTRDMTILSVGDGNSDDSLSDHNYAAISLGATESHYDDDYQELPPPSVEVMQYELETKIALDALDLVPEFEKTDLELLERS